MEAVSAKVILYDQSNIGTLEWPDTEYGQYACKYILPLLEHRAEHFIRNVRTRIEVVTVDGIPIPITINEQEYENTYVCSPYTHYVSYAREELSLLNNRLLEKGLTALLSGIGFLLRGAHFNRVVQVNNWLLSTNLYPDVSAEQLIAILDFLRQRFPGYALLFRSLNRETSGAAVTALSSYGCKLVPSRQIYLLQQPSPSKAKWLLKRDRALLDKQGYQIVGPGEIGAEDISRIVDLYELLYIHKYSKHNPMFTEAFIKLALDTGTLTLYGLRKDGRLDAAMGFFCRAGLMTAPLFGYDTTLPQSTGLYRMLSAVLIGLAEQNGHILHESSGVGQFKRNRGAVAAIEVSAVYDRYLPLRTRFSWSVLEKVLNRIGIPIIQKLKL
ncbi:GNAT family N-acetyltransferase [Paenibacillus sp. 19GGS1-52]|uniref:GNAT family N-acetyltransferase n=1 Tax=Paenibacillus sp. 19GGS1-52 TaxID=2758563 RepID=UPI001EFA5E04|nr:GNAT family N-acetyltransferase [Paenibacillus sp. 19GGS1-52]ULO05573.1 GNAT family N-acetyltransferase [Paenibacillus sp. 19GGS1-52]